jgi:hypothetical protein
MHYRYFLVHLPQKGIGMLLVIRGLLGGILVLACIGKLLDLPGFVLVLRSYSIFPRELLWPITIGITASELFVGSWLLWGRQLRQAAYASLALHASYAIWAIFMLLRNKTIINCGCFGSFMARPLSWWTVGQNLVLIALSLILVWRAGSKTVPKGAP